MFIREDPKVSRKNLMVNKKAQKIRRNADLQNPHKEIKKSMISKASRMRNGNTRVKSKLWSCLVPTERRST
jgi:hypothetical protein